MNQKIMIFLSIVIIVIGVAGFFQKTQKEKTQDLTFYENKINELEKKLEEKTDKGENLQEQKKQLKSQTLTAWTANRDLRVGEILTIDDINSKKVAPEDLSKEAISSKYMETILDSIVVRDIKQDSFIGKIDIAKKGSKEYKQIRLDPKRGVSYAFKLDRRHFLMLNSINASDKVNIYFRYETKSDEENTLVPNPDEKSYAGQETATISNLKLLFKNKKVLFNQKFIASSRVDKSKQQTRFIDKRDKKDKTFGYLYVELMQDEIKKIIAVEKLGEFFILPNLNDNTSLRRLTTKEIFQKEFVKELKGNKHE